MPENKLVHDGGKEAVCVDAGRVYDSCADKDCLEDLRVYFTERDQMIIDHAGSIRTRGAEVLNVCIDVEPLPFNRGYYACDLTFYFKIDIDVMTGRCTPCNVVSGIAVFCKKVILYGSEGNVKVFCSEFAPCACDKQDLPTQNLPKCCVQVAEPIVLSARICGQSENANCGFCCDCSTIPDYICNRYGGGFTDTCEKRVVVTIGIFSIVQLVRNVQMLMPVYDFCLPSKECSCPDQDSPCDLFRKMNFPVNEFFPPKQETGGCGC